MTGIVPTEFNEFASLLRAAKALEKASPVTSKVLKSAFLDYCDELAEEGGVSAQSMSYLQQLRSKTQEIEEDDELEAKLWANRTFEGLVGQLTSGELKSSISTQFYVLSVVFSIFNDDEEALELSRRCKLTAAKIKTMIEKRTTSSQSEDIHQHQSYEQQTNATFSYPATQETPQQPFYGPGNPYYVPPERSQEDDPFKDYFVPPSEADSASNAHHPQSFLSSKEDPVLRYEGGDPGGYDETPARIFFAKYQIAIVRKPREIDQQTRQILLKYLNAASLKLKAGEMRQTKIILDNALKFWIRGKF